MSNNDNLVDKLNRYPVIAIVHLILWALLVILVYKNVMLPAILMEEPFGIYNNNGKLTIIDFPFLFNAVKELWTSKAIQNTVNSIYSVENYLNFTSKWAGFNCSYSLPFCYSPTIIWLLSPLIPFSHATAFSIFNIAGLWSIWWQTRPLRCRLGAGLLVFFSPLAYACLLLGQTALLTGAGLLYVAENSKEEQSDRSRLKSTIFTGTVLWLLTAKTPLALTAGAVLLSCRKWQPIIVALLLTVVMTVIISPLLGTGWINDYVEMMKTYDLVQADKVYAWSLVPQHMANLRAILHIDLNVADNIASKISSITWLCSLIVLITFGARLRLNHAALWALGILFYLLFCPHVSSTEEVQLALLLPLCVPVRKEKLSSQELALFVFIPLLPFMSPAVGPFFLDSRWGLFCAKVFLVIFIAYYFRENQGGILEFDEGE